MDKTFFSTTQLEADADTTVEIANFQLAELQLAVSCGGVGEVIFG